MNPSRPGAFHTGDCHSNANSSARSAGEPGGRQREELGSGRAACVKVAALFVDPHGVYSGLEGVDVWGEDRDARLYAGPYPVVAHPPCARWCALAPLNAAMHGYAIGDDGGCFEAALAAVEKWGGVLDPAGVPRRPPLNGPHRSLGGRSVSARILYRATQAALRPPKSSPSGRGGGTG